MPFGVNYQYPLNDCDIDDPKALKVFRAKRDLWIEWLRGDTNSINTQIIDMLWNEQVYWIINESRGLAQAEGGSFATSSGTLAAYFDKSYVAIQFLAIRKLLELQPRNPRKSVISLRRLVDELVDNREIISREMYVCFDGLPFDYSVQLTTSTRQFSTGVRSEKIGGPHDNFSSERAHRAFDEMCEEEPDHAERNQLISADFLESLSSRLDDTNLQNIRTYANKVVSHSPAPESIPAEGIPSVTFHDIHEAQRIICGVATCLSDLVLRDQSIGGFPIPSFDVFRNWDKPFVPEGSLTALHKIWAQHTERKDEWFSRVNWD